MQLSADQKRLLERIINVFETGTVEGDYSNISIYKDGPHKIRQITYGRSQTTEYGNLRKLVQQYAAAAGMFSQELQPYADRVWSVPLTDDANFKSLLRKAGKQDPVMRTVQDAFFEEVYFRPAMKWADQHGFTLALSALVIYDSFIHSGSILGFLRSRFPENPPSSGGDEGAWIKAYVNARHNWLGSSSSSDLRATVYRTQCFKREIQRANWDLSQVPVNANGTKVSP